MVQQYMCRTQMGNLTKNCWKLGARAPGPSLKPPLPNDLVLWNSDSVRDASAVFRASWLTTAATQYAALGRHPRASLRRTGTGPNFGDRALSSAARPLTSEHLPLDYGQPILSYSRLGYFEAENLPRKVASSSSPPRKSRRIFVREATALCVLCQAARTRLTQ